VAALVAASLAMTLGPAAHAQDFDVIQKRGVLKLLLTKSDEVPSRAFGAVPTAFDRELLDSFASVYKLRIETISVNAFSELLPALTRGQGDVALGLAPTRERARIAAFTREVLPSRQVVVSRTTAVTEASDLLRLRVGTVPGSASAQRVAALGVAKANIDASFRDVDELIDGLVAGKVAAVVLSSRYAVLARRQHPDLQIGVALEEGQRAAYAVRTDAPRLLAALDNYLVELRRLPTWSRLLVKHFGESGAALLKLGQ
jgi:membrane-bound lytic murein transglycosylase F